MTRCAADEPGCERMRRATAFEPARDENRKESSPDARSHTEILLPWARKITNGAKQRRRAR